ncbi:MAG: stage II sporulation protein P [Bacilli bacterium]|nr:stage II sporulation protein P [Bacilli bacterium]
MIRKKRHSLKRKILFSLTMFLIGIIISFKVLENKHIDINNKYNDLLLEMTYKSLSNKTYLEMLKEDEKEEVVDNPPLIYIYNTHDREEYKTINGLTPTVKVVNNILKSKFNSNNINVLVEERSIKDLLNLNNWNYSYSYKASRLYIDEVKSNNPSIKYFIDVHRDSLDKSRTTVTINDKSYASLLFIVGLDNPTYNLNLDFTNKINNKLDEKYPNLSKGILQKGGVGVNGIYNQDVSGYSILIEVGGYENNIHEVLNSTIAFYECFMEVINEN